MERRRLALLSEMGVDVWVRRDSGVPVAVAPQTPVSRVRPECDARRRGPVWEELKAQVEECRRCGLHQTRNRAVFGVGDRCVDWLFIGEAPGADEDRQGEPFVGRAGQLLTNMIRALGMEREQVYITNILKCRPPGNRDPRPEESQACRPYLERQIELLNPKVIVALGRIAAQNLLETDQPLGRLRGRPHEYLRAGIPVVVTYHPAYLLRSPREKRKVWQDLRLARQVVAIGSHS